MKYHCLDLKPSPQPMTASPPLSILPHLPQPAPLLRPHPTPPHRTHTDLISDGGPTDGSFSSGQLDLQQIVSKTTHLTAAARGSAGAACDAAAAL